MSVVQHIRDRAGHFRWMGLLVVWAVFIAMAAVLLVERAGVQYSAGQHKLGMLAANDAVPASSAIFGQKSTCLVITDTLISNLIRTLPIFIRTCTDEYGNPIP